MTKLARLLGVMGVCALNFLLPPAHAAETIRIGQTAVATGPMATNGVAYSQGIRLYLDGVNRAGGVGGRKIELVSLDDGYDPARAKENARKLIEQEEVTALLGLTGTGASMAVAPLAEEAGVPVVGFLSGSPELRKLPGTHHFHVRATYADEVAAMVRHLRTIGITELGAVYQDDPFGRSALAALKVEAERQQSTLAAVVGLAGPGYEAAEGLAGMRKAGAKAVLMLTAGKASVSFIRAAYQADYRPMFLGLSVVSADELIANLGKDAHGLVISQVVPHPGTGKHAIVREFEQAAKGSNVPAGSHVALEGYMAAKLLVEGLKRSGAKPSRATLTSALRELGRIDLGDFPVGLNESSGKGGSYVDLSMVRSAGGYAH